VVFFVETRRICKGYNEKEITKMNTRLYTNTGKLTSIVGLVVTTVAVSYAAQHSTEIVNGTVAIAKKGLNASKKLVMLPLTKEVSIWSTAPSGQVYDTGMKIRVSKFRKVEAK
jgi:hypothetical protein